MKSRIARALVTSLAPLLLTALPQPVEGQEQEPPPPPIGPGARVRLRHVDPCCGRLQVGVLASVSADSVVVRTGSERRPLRIALPREAVRSLELGYDAGTYIWRGATIGGIVGALGGVTLVLNHDCEGDDLCESFRPYAAVVWAGIAGLGGLVVGGIVGVLVPRMDWVRVPLPERVGLAPTPDRGLAVRFTLRL